MNTLRHQNSNPGLAPVNKTNGYLHESNGNKYLMLVSTDESKGTRKKEKLQNKIRVAINHWKHRKLYCDRDDVSEAVDFD